MFYFKMYKIYVILLLACIIPFIRSQNKARTSIEGLIRDPSFVQFFLMRDWGNQTEILLNDTNSLTKSGFDPSQKTFLLIDGYDSPRNPFYELITKAIRSNNVTNQDNILIVDYRKLSGRETSLSANAISGMFLYFSVLKNVNILGEKVGDFLYFLHSQGQLSLDNVHIIGMSMGCHIAGAATSYLQILDNPSLKIGRITGLDPARTFYPLRRVQRLRSGHGGVSFIDSYHTNRGTLGEVYEGTTDLNVYVNGGAFQPGCGRHDFTLFPLPGICSHLYAWEMFAASFSRDLYACPCTQWGCYCHQNCSTCSSDTDGSIKIGLNADKSARGTYHATVTDPMPGEYYQQFGKEIYTRKWSS